MKAEADIRSNLGEGLTGAEPAGKKGRLSLLRSVLPDTKLSGLLRLYRFASLALSGGLFLLFPGYFHLYTQLGLLLLVFSTAVLLTFLYEYFWNNRLVVALLAALEVAGITMLLVFTGGFGSPFLWYALNPFVVASAYFSFAWAWLTVAALLAGTFGLESYLFPAGGNQFAVTLADYYPVLNLVVLALVIHMYARMNMVISERVLERESQKMELMSAQENLSKNYEVFKSLSKFQRQVVAYNHPKDIYYTLIETLINLFPFRQAAILIPPAGFEARQGYSSSENQELHFQVLGSNEEKTRASFLRIQQELENRWEELHLGGAKKLLIGEKRTWIALPLRGENKRITAVFVGWLKPGTNPVSFSENLFLFIRFAEQTTEWLSMFKQKERVLQHISAVYEAVETVSSQNDPKVVIELFASYAKALTDCDKTIFWMINAGDGQNDENFPIYSVKGPRSSFPEEQWHSTLLQVWSEIHTRQEPVAVEIGSGQEKRANLISVPVKTGSHCFGMLACVQSNHTFTVDEVIQILSVLADLSAIAVVRTRADMFAEKLAVIDEQKRIASEIHDTISQNLFSIVYSIDALSREAGHRLNELHQESLADIKNISAETARELRALIYRLSPGQSANESFINEINSYLDKMSRMNAVEIKHSVTGSADYLNPAICRNLYRIIKESTGNALRHGNCSEILVHLNITPFHTQLKVSDNGDGFDMQSSVDLYTSGNRLGIVNMRELALSLQGTLHIDSKPGRGTEVSCSIPTSPVSVE